MNTHAFHSRPITHRQTSGLASVGLAVLAGLTLSACGGGSPTKTTASLTKATGLGNAVAQVGNTPISRTMFDHWIAIAFAFRNPPTPGQAPSTPVVPDPPNYTSCVAQLMLRASKPKPNAEQLKHECERDYADVQPRILHFLIHAYWIRGEATDEVVQVSEAEVQKRFQQITKKNYPKAADFQKYLAGSDQTIPDLLFSLKTEMLTAKLEQNATKGAKGKAAKTVLTKSAQNLEKKWKAETSCIPGFVIRDCKQFSSG
jgi:hypothetical protein